MLGRHAIPRRHAAVGPGPRGDQRISDTKRMLPRLERAVMRGRAGTRQGPHRLAPVAGEIHLVGRAAHAAHVRVGRAIRARRRRQAIGTAAIGRFGTRNRAAIRPRRGRDDGRRLAPPVTARGAEQCGHHDTTVCHEHLSSPCIADRDDESPGRCGRRPAPAMVHVRVTPACPVSRAPLARSGAPPMTRQ